MTTAVGRNQSLGRRRKSTKQFAKLELFLDADFQGESPRRLRGFVPGPAILNLNFGFAAGDRSEAPSMVTSASHPGSVWLAAVFYQLKHRLSSVCDSPPVSRCPYFRQHDLKFVV